MGQLSQKRMGVEYSIAQGYNNPAHHGTTRWTLLGFKRLALSVLQENLSSSYVCLPGGEFPEHALRLLLYWNRIVPILTGGSRNFRDTHPVPSEGNPPHLGQPIY
jgi:hypothetical protein